MPSLYCWDPAWTVDSPLVFIALSLLKPTFKYWTTPSLILKTILFSFFLFLLTLIWGYIQWFLEREEEVGRKRERQRHRERQTSMRERERERNISVREKHPSAASHTCLDWGVNSQPRYVPWPGIKPKPYGVQGDTPTNWATWPGLYIFFSGILALGCFYCLESRDH